MHEGVLYIVQEVVRAKHENSVCTQRPQLSREDV